MQISACAPRGGLKSPSSWMRVSAKRSACAGLAMAPGSQDANALMSTSTVSLSCRSRKFCDGEQG